MRKAILIIIMSIFLTNCESFEDDCSCGLIESDRVTDYSIVVRNDCTGNVKRWYLTRGDWLGAHVGTDYCITNSTGW